MINVNIHTATQAYLCANTYQVRKISSVIVYQPAVRRLIGLDDYD